MNESISDSRLYKLLRGELCDSEQARLESAIETDAALRERWERLSHAGEWPVGSAPLPQPLTSESLSGVMASLLTSVGDEEHSPPNTSESAEVPELRKLSGLSGIRILRELGRGGMGVVYEGVDDLLQRRVAVKQLFPSESKANDKRRLLHEAQAIAQLRHENILDVYGVALFEGTPVLVQQFVDGLTLEQRLRQAPPLQIEQCIDFARQIASGLAAAHVAGVIHRDLKPSNILLQQETHRLLIADFGLAKSSQGEAGSLSIIAGTPAYMSPEQSRGDPVDQRSDLFSFGTLLYRMVTNKLPFDHEDPKEVLRMIRQTEASPAHSVRSDVPLWFSACIAELMAKSPEARPPSAEAFIERLDKQARQVVVAPAKSRNSMRRSLLWLSGAAVLTAMIGGYRRFGRQIDSILKFGSQTSTGVVAMPSIEQREGLWIEGDTQEVASLAEAVELAADGATIRLASDLQTSRLVVQGKRLIIAAAEGRRPRITCRDPEKGGPARFFIQTHSDLTLRGLVVDWQPIEDIPLFADGQFASVVSCHVDAKLLMENCELTSSQTGAVVGVGGNVVIRNCSVSGGDFSVGWMAFNSVAELDECTLKSDVGVCVAFPPLGAAMDESTQLKLKRTRFLTRSAVDLALLRIPEQSVPVFVEDCLFQGASVITLTGLTNRAPVLQTAADIRKQAQTLLQWHESGCEYSEANAFLDARTFRTLKRWKDAGIRSASEWENFWQMPPDAADR